MAPEDKKKKLEMVDVEPSDFCDFSTTKFPGPDSDQEMKDKLGKSKKKSKASD